MSANSRKAIETRLIVRAWKDEAFRKQLLADPKAAMAKELGVDAAKAFGSISIQALEETPNKLYFVIPANPNEGGGSELEDAELEAVAGGGASKEFTSFKCVTYPMSLGGTCPG